MEHVQRSLPTEVVRVFGPDGPQSTAEAARALAAAGVPVFPCIVGGKRPLTAHGFLDATTDLERLASWWRATPRANIGMPTGATSGLDVVDVDVRGSETGFPAIQAARRAGLVDGFAWMVRTPSGGLHAYYPHLAGTEQRSWSSPTAHVDFRGDGGYVVVPPSVVRRDGGTVAYALSAVAQDRPRPLDADALHTFVDPGYGAVRGAPAVDIPDPQRHTDPTAIANWLRTVPEGGRNYALFWAARQMRDAQFDHASTLGALGPAAQAAGLAPSEIAATVRSTFRRPRAPSTRSGPTRRTDPPQAVTP